MNRHQAKRLLKLILFIEDLPRKQFDYRDFVSRFEIKPSGHVCGTICCAAGWMPAVFRQFTWRDSLPNTPFGFDYSKDVTDQYNRRAFFGLNMAQDFCIFAGGVYLDIPGWETCEGSPKRTPKQWGGRARKMLRHLGYDDLAKWRE